MTDTRDGMTFTYFTYLVLLHYLVKVKHRKCNITAGYYQRKLHQMYHTFIKVDQGHHMLKIYLLGVLYSNAYMKQRFMTSMTFENA